MRSVLLCVLLSCVATVQAEPPTVTMKTIGTPIHAARCWTQAVAPRPDGGDWIALFWNYRSLSNRDELPQWLVVDLASGQSRSFELPGYANSNYQIKNQLRAANGRIFFSCADGNIHYYDPAERSMKSLGKLLPEKAAYSFFYRLVFGPDGKLYATSQSSNRKTALLRIDPETLERRVWLDLGDPERADGLTYGYYLAADPPWVYIAQGQNRWRLIAVNTDTGEQKVLGKPCKWIELGTTDAGVRASLSFEPDPNSGITGNAARYDGNVLHMANGKKEYWWCHEGELYPAIEQTKTDTIPGKTLRERFPLPAQSEAAPVLPEIELTPPDSTGQMTLKWRHGDQDWKALPVKCDRVEPVQLESLTRLPDGSLLGNAVQYNGFFRWHPDGGRIETFGPHGPSRPVVRVVDGIVYFSGYPNSALYRYDPAQAWAKDSNPKSLGTFGQFNHAHYCYYLLPGPNRRLYTAGRCERNFTGSGVGWMDLDSGQMHGHNRDLNFLTPRGLVVLPDLQRLVFSGTLNDDPNAKTAKPTEAQLVIFDLDLKEVERLTVKPGLVNTGHLRAIKNQPNVVLGCIVEKNQAALYRYDIAARKLLTWRDLEPGDYDLYSDDADQLWLVRGNRELGRLDPTTLNVTPTAMLDQPTAGLIFAAGTLYGRAGASFVSGQLPK